jgi:hypothetical protein
VRTCALVVAAGLLFRASTADAAAPTKAECIDAYDRAQVLQHQSKLIEARAALRTCVQSTCPAAVQQDCGGWLEQANRAQPTIAFSVKDGSGNDRSDVRVSVDGRVLAERLGGAAFEVDPGEHTFTFTSTGPPEPEMTRRLVVVEGDKGRRELLVMGATPPSPAPLGPPTLPPAQPEASQGHPTQRLLGIVSMGVGGAALVVGGIFGALTLSNVSTQKTDCIDSSKPGGCPLYGPASAAHSAAVTDGAVSTGAFIAGGVLVVAGATLFFTAGRSDPHPAAHAILTPNVDAHGAGLLLRGSFW